MAPGTVSPSAALYHRLPPLMSALARIKRTAAQHEQERQYDKALALYARLLDGADAGEEEVDVGLFNRAGDLALRLGDPARAVGYFERALDLYAAAGLLNNAVALGVKILRHAPNHLSAHYTLGVLYGRKGFGGDARHHLLTYAVQMQRAGRADEAARVLAEVAATCAGSAELRAAYDAYGALGGDPAHAVSLDTGAAPVTAPAETPSADVAAIDALALHLLEPAALVGEPGDRTAILVDERLPMEMPHEFVLDATVLDSAMLDAWVPSSSVLESSVLEDSALGEVLGGESAAIGAADPAPEFMVAFDHHGAAAADGPEGGADLVFLDVPAHAVLDDEAPAPAPLVDVIAPVAAHAGADEAATPAWAFALPNEPPPLRLADLADVARPRLAPALAPTAGSANDDAPAWHDAAWTPAERAPGRFADLLAVELATAPVPADAAPPVDVASAPPMPGEEAGLDLGAWLRETTPAESTRMTTAAVPQSGDEQADFAATLRAFTAGVTRTVGHEDFDSHYDLGVAFREMGLLDEAIVQFQRAAQAPGRPLRALEALAQCFVDDAQPELALSTLASPVAAADAAGIGDAALVGVHYLMGSAAQALGRADDARRWLMRVVATDVRFRDASQRLAALPPPTPIR